MSTVFPFRPHSPTLNLAAFQSNQNPISGRANSICFISSREEEAGAGFGSVDAEGDMPQPRVQVSLCLVPRALLGFSAENSAVDPISFSWKEEQL